MQLYRIICTACSAAHAGQCQNMHCHGATPWRRYRDHPGCSAANLKGPPLCDSNRLGGGRQAGWGVGCGFGRSMYGPAQGCEVGLG